MGILVALLGILLVLVACDVQMRFFYLVEPGNRFTRLSRLQFWGFRNIIALVKAYTGFRVIRDSRLKAPLPDRFLILSNHQSLADIAVLAYAFPGHNVRFVAKKELRHGVPGVSFFLRKGQHALVDRHGDFRRTQAQLVKLARLSRRQAVCPAVFPEGTRSRSGLVRPFHSAAVRTILAQAPLPSVSVAVNGGYRIAKLKNLARDLPGCVYRVRLLSLYPPPRGRSEVQAMLEQAHDEIKQQVDTWRKCAK